ncbi:hypothetical protein ACLESO_30825, partial [Pyxidicoccus sp. 3LG]
ALARGRQRLERGTDAPGALGQLAAGENCPVFRPLLEERVEVMLGTREASLFEEVDEGARLGHD